MKDPVEKVIEDALQSAGIMYATPESDYYPKGRERTKGLDFYLINYGVHIEVCQFYTERKIEQLERVENAILIQGMNAAIAFAALLRSSPPPASTGNPQQPKTGPEDIGQQSAGYLLEELRASQDTSAGFRALDNSGLRS